MTKYQGTFYELDSGNEVVKTNLRETPKLPFQEGFISPNITKDQAADLISDLLMEGIITQETFLHFINRYPDELL